MTPAASVLPHVLPDGQVIELNLSTSFWKRCSELRSAQVGRWLSVNGLAPLPKALPPVFELAERRPARS